MSTLTKVAAILLDAGWRGAADAQWSGLESALPELKQALAQPSEQPAVLACYDCALPYADPGFADFVVPDDVWLKISPTGNEGGILCATCMFRRMAALGIECDGRFTSGPCAQHDWKKPAKAEQPGDVGLARKIALDLANFLFRSTGEKPFTGGIVVDVIESVISPHLAALAPSVPAEAVATREDVRRAFWQGFEASRMNPGSYDIDSHWRIFLSARESRGDTWMRANTAPPANDEAVRLLHTLVEELIQGGESPETRKAAIEWYYRDDHRPKQAKGLNHG